MFSSIFIKALVLGIFALSLAACSSMISSPAKRHVILIIGDGMDDHQISIARNYLYGARGELTMDKLPVRSSVRVLTVDENSPEIPVYVADSANSATSIATGLTTSRGRIATTARRDEDIETIAELAAKADYDIGIVTTSSITDATPAAFISHIRYRGCENPTVMAAPPYSGQNVNCISDMKANGGAGSIAEQIADKPWDVIFGGGLKHFQQPVEEGNQTILAQARNTGYHIVQNIDQLNHLNQTPALGLFASSTLPTVWRGENNRRAELVSRQSTGLSQSTTLLPAPMRCEPNPKFAGHPRLKTLTDKALQLLSDQENRGFLLMIESASIDKQAHRANPCGSIGELLQLEETLDSVLAFAEKNPNTLILVTADHGQAAQLISPSSLIRDIRKPVHSPGRIARLITEEGQLLGVNYAVNNYHIQEHTGTQIPLMGNSEGEGKIPASIVQPELFNIIKNHLGL